MNVADTFPAASPLASIRESPLGPLAIPEFRLLWTSGLGVNLALWMQAVGAAWLMLSLAPSPLMVASIQTAQSLPIFLFGLPGGVLADVIDRRALILFSYAWFTVCVGIASLLTFTGDMTPALLLVVTAALGASYGEGAPLFRIVKTDRVELQAQVPPAEAQAAHAISALAFEVPGRPDPIDLKPDHVHDAGVVDPKTRALPLQIEVENRGGQVLVGQTGTAVLYTGRTQRVPVVPRDAVLMESGRPYVFVQTSGERFARRFVEIASRDGDVVGLRSGVMVGDRVVTRGAYEIQLASSAKGLPAEGHVH